MLCLDASGSPDGVAIQAGKLAWTTMDILEACGALDSSSNLDPGVFLFYIFKKEAVKESATNTPIALISRVLVIVVRTNNHLFLYVNLSE